ncbi:MAG: Fe-S-containing hydro-lyase [Eubacteriaceae bacterium]|nr:Fe-S-containing hydro-lyase [Eubacteriaceae bacterium]
MSNIKLEEPFTKEKMKELKAGDSVLISGTVYTARDAAHKRMVEALAAGEDIPVPIENAIIYYVGPTPARDGRPIGSAGPTTSYRMDAYAPALLDLGQTGMIGKGPRDQTVVDSMKKNGAVYFAAIGGAGALISKSIVSAEVIAYDDLGAEAVRKLTVKDMPVIVATDSRGFDLYGKEQR